MWPFLLPHEYLRSMLDDDPTLFDRSRQFPDGLAPLARELEANCQKQQIPEGETICLGLHGDGVPYTKKDSMNIVSWNIASSCP